MLLELDPVKKGKEPMEQKNRLPLWAVAALVLVLCGSFTGCTFLAALGLMAATDTGVEVYEDCAEYSRFIGPRAENRFIRTAREQDSFIFPLEIRQEMEVQAFKLVYYNPWDPQWLCYLTVEYPQAAYEAELDRLAAFPREDYAGIYSVTGFADPEDPLAIDADDYMGFVYAIRTPDRSRSVTYVLIWFHNYFMDLDYNAYIPAPYLPLGFDASPANPYRQAYWEAHPIDQTHGNPAQGDTDPGQN